MKLAIIGSRTFNDYNLAYDIYQKHFSPHVLVIVSGGAKGADTIAERLAAEFQCRTEIYYPDWDKHGKAAGFIRNKDIINNCDAVLAFWDKESKGTVHSLKFAKELNKPTMLVYFTPQPPEDKTLPVGL